MKSRNRNYFNTKRNTSQVLQSEDKMTFGTRNPSSKYRKMSEAYFNEDLANGNNKKHYSSTRKIKVNKAEEYIKLIQLGMTLVPNGNRDVLKTQRYKPKKKDTNKIKSMS